MTTATPCDIINVDVCSKTDVHLSRAPTGILYAYDHAIILLEY